MNQREIIPIEYIIELGLIRKRNQCAKCGKEMDVENYNIQLCKSCRKISLEKYTKEELTKGGKWDECRMKELKTLKDINLTEIEHDFEMDGTDYVQEDIKNLLKAEAIKWVKELNKIYNSEIPSYDSDKEYGGAIKFKEFFISKFKINIDVDDEYGWTYQEIKILMDFIKHFFNITAEELVNDLKGDMK